MRPPPLVFIACATPDRAIAVRLHQALADAGLRPWCEAIDLIPGQKWDEVIPAMLDGAAAIVVVVTRLWPVAGQPSGGWYEQEGVAWAIDHARDATRTALLVPVRVDGAGRSRLPYGLRRLVDIEVASRDLRPIVKGIARALEHRQPMPPAPRHTEDATLDLAPLVGLLVVLAILATPAMFILTRPANDSNTSPPVTPPPDLATPLRPALVLIEPREFVMGSPEDEPGRLRAEWQHTVRLRQGYWMAETEVTQAQWAAVMGDNPSFFQGSVGDGQRPVESVRWIDAVRYCNSLSAREGLMPAYAVSDEDVSWRPGAPGYRLPTEAEWEYAARAGTTTATYIGGIPPAARSVAALDLIAWYGGNSETRHPKGYPAPDSGDAGMRFARVSTHPVGGKQPNRWGLHDMLGNVREWTWDWYVEVDPSVPDGAVVDDPRGPPRGGGRVVRGGSFNEGVHTVRAAARYFWPPGHRALWLGFRPVRTASRGSASRP